MKFRWVIFFYFLGAWSTIEAYLLWNVVNTPSTNSMNLWPMFMLSWSVIGVCVFGAGYIFFRILFHEDSCSRQSDS